MTIASLILTSIVGFGFSEVPINDWERPLLLFEQHPGFVPPAEAASTTCSISNKNLTKTFKQYLTTIETVEQKSAFVADIKSLDNLIAAAAEGKIEAVPGPVDVPTITFKAFIQKSQKGPVIEVLLSSTGGGQVQINRSNEANELIRATRALCK